MKDRAQERTNKLRKKSKTYSERNLLKANGSVKQRSLLGIELANYWPQVKPNWS